MLREKTRSDEERRGAASTKPSRGKGLARRALPFAAALLAGYVLRKRSKGGLLPASLGGRGAEQAETTVPDEREEVADTDVEQPSSMGSVAGEETRQTEREGEEQVQREGEKADQGSESDQQRVESEREQEEAAAALSAPTSRGMPMLGLGTYRNDDYDQCVESVRTALELGYRHVDTAQMYDNEDAVGDAIAEADVDREDLYVATKVTPDNLDYDHVLSSTEESLERLGLEYVDLLYVHWPTGEYEATDTLDAFAELRREGITERIGVSNFEPEQLEEAIDVAEEPIFANQIEMHPLLPQTELLQFCAQDDVDVEIVAYAPIARGDVEDVDEIRDIAEKHDATPAQVSLAWLREKGVTAIPKATGREHIRENWLSLGVELDAEDVERIDDVDREERLVDPDRAPWNE